MMNCHWGQEHGWRGLCAPAVVPVRSSSPCKHTRRCWSRQGRALRTGAAAGSTQHRGELAQTPKFPSKHIHFTPQGAPLEVCTTTFCLWSDVCSVTAHQVSFSQLCSEPASKGSTLQITLITTAVFAFFQSPNNALTILGCLLPLRCDNEIQSSTAAHNPSLLF